MPERNKPAFLENFFHNFLLKKENIMKLFYLVNVCEGNISSHTEYALAFPLAGDFK